MSMKSVTYCLSSPSICPTIRLEMPIPIICMEVVRPMAVPTVAWLTTRGIDGHILDYNQTEKFVAKTVLKSQEKGY